jgi:hypothetical protein
VAGRIVTAITIHHVEVRVKKAEKRFAKPSPADRTATIQPAINELEVWSDVLRRVQAAEDPLLAVMSR